MKIFSNKIATALISLFTCLAIFITVMVLTLFPYKTNEQAVAKQQPNIGYVTQNVDVTTSILINIENCPTVFLAKISSKTQKISLSCRPKICISQNKETLNGFQKSEYQKHIELTVLQLDDIINYIGGVELETPYGLPSPSNTDIKLTENERVLVYGASLSALICKESEPSPTKMAYYCYVLSEVCLKFLKNCDTNYYKFLKNNSKTDISYTDFYDNFKFLKESIKYTDYLTPNGFWQNGVFYMQ